MAPAMHGNGVRCERAHTLGLLNALLADVCLLAVALVGHADVLARRHAALRHGVQYQHIDHIDTWTRSQPRCNNTLQLLVDMLMAPKAMSGESCPYDQEGGQPIAQRANPNASIYPDTRK